MAPDQLPLLPKTKEHDYFNLDIKSPIFAPEPGWGGQLKSWLSRHFSSKILPVISLGVLAVGIYLFFR